MKKYIVAVSGGLDSVTLLHLLTSAQIPPGRKGNSIERLESQSLDWILKQSTRTVVQTGGVQDDGSAEFIVAHVNHGIRPDSDRTEKFVRSLAKKYNLKFVSTKLKLKGSSEDEARRARYQALLKLKDDFQAEAIITAHNHNDILETAIINITRGTGWRGLSSLSSSKEILRPLLSLSRAEISKIAGDANLSWHEDATNSDEAYLRNRIRKTILPSLSSAQLQALSSLIDEAAKLKAEINQILDCLIKLNDDGSLSLKRSELQLIGSDLTKELLVYILPKFQATYDKKVVDALSTFCLSAFGGKRFLQAGNNLEIICQRTGKTRDYEIKFSKNYQTGSSWIYFRIQ